MAAAATVAPTYTNDFIELHNRGTIAVDVNGWSVQYASSAGTTWAVTNLSRLDSAGRLLPDPRGFRWRWHDSTAHAGRDG